MNIKTICAAAAVAVTVGQAQAATVDRVSMTLNAEYICEIGDCEDPAPEMYFEGFQFGLPIIGYLNIGDANSFNERIITFLTNAGTYYLGAFEGDNGSYAHPTSHYSYALDWDGTFGSLRYRDDDYPWSLAVEGTIELAPVPLPATAALLPMGLGALAMMRRRRKA